MADDQKLPDGVKGELSEERRRDVDHLARRAGAALRSPAPTDGVRGIALKARNQRIVRVAGAIAGAGALLVGVFVITDTGDSSEQQRPSDVSTGPSVSATDVATTTPESEPPATPESATTMGSTTTVASPTGGTLDFTLVGRVDGRPAAYLAGGSVLAVGGAGGVVRFYDSESLTLLRELACPTSETVGPDLSADVEWLPEVAATWDTESRGVLTAMASPLSPGECPMVFSTGGRLAARASRGSTGEDESTIWDTRDGTVVAVVPGRSPKFSPDGSTVLTDGWGGIRVWDVATGSQLAELMPATIGGAVWAEYSPDGSRVAAGDRAGALIIWDAHTFAEVLRLTLPRRDAYDVSFSSDGTRIATASLESASVWDMASGEELVRLPAHGGELLQVEFSPNDTLIATGGLGPVVVYDAVTGDELARLGGTTDMPGGFFVFSPDGSALAMGMVGDLGVWQWRY